MLFQDPDGLEPCCHHVPSGPSPSISMVFYRKKTNAGSGTILLSSPFDLPYLRTEPDRHFPIEAIYSKRGRI